jgi:hypothetical protein
MTVPMMCFLSGLLGLCVGMLVTAVILCWEHEHE